MRTVCTLVLTVLCTLACSARLAGAYEAPKIDDPKDRQVLDAFLTHTKNLTASLTVEYAKAQAAKDAESYCWILLNYLRLPLLAYKLTGDARQLDTFTAAFANLRAAMTTGPDGFLDWYGKPEDIFQDPQHPDQAVDIDIVSFRAVTVLSEFVEAIDADPALASKYAAERTAYLDLMQNQLVKKWDVRGRYVDLGKGGAIFRTNALLKPAKANLTEPHNKHHIIIEGLLGLHRVTGNDEYLKKAIKLGVRYKHSLTFKDGHYEWNYWDPAGAWDVDTADAAKWKMWIGVEHKGGYYASSLSQAAALYEHGLVFDQTDMARFVKTQKEKCWNGDFTSPKWARCDGTTSDKYMQGAYMCGALAPLDETIAKFCFTGPRQDERVKSIHHDWQGSVVASDYLEGKYLTAPATQGGKLLHGDIGARFRSNPQNAAWLKELEFEVKDGNYAAPQAPAGMKDMPQEPK